MFSIEQIELIRRLRNSGITKQQVIEAFDSLDRVEGEFGNLFNTPVNYKENKKKLNTGESQLKPADLVITPSLQTVPSHSKSQQIVQSDFNKGHCIINLRNPNQPVTNQGNNSKTLPTEQANPIPFKSSQQIIIRTPSLGTNVNNVTSSGNAVYSKPQTSVSQPVTRSRKQTEVDTSSNSKYVQILPRTDTSISKPVTRSRKYTEVDTSSNLNNAQVLKNSRQALSIALQVKKPRLDSDIPANKDNVDQLNETEEEYDPNDKECQTPVYSSDGQSTNLRRERFTFREKHLEVLEIFFKENPYPTYEQRETIANLCNLACSNNGARKLHEKEKVTPYIVLNWFANSRKEVKKLAKEEGITASPSILPSRIHRPKVPVQLNESASETSEEVPKTDKSNDVLNNSNEIKQEDFTIIKCKEEPT